MWSVFPYSIDAASHLTSREEVFAFVEKAFRAQVSLSKEAREMEEIEEILTPYFSDKLIYLFLNENLTGEQGNFLHMVMNLVNIIYLFINYQNKPL